MTDESLQCTPDLRTNALSFCNPNIDVSNFLNLNSLENHDEFCLAYVFTYRDFSGGTLGLAWVGSPSGKKIYPNCYGVNCLYHINPITDNSFYKLF